MARAGAPAVSVAQQSGSAVAAVAGGALGLTSGATLALVGSLVPCTQSRPGPTCVRWSAIGGGALGLTGGAMLGASDSDQLRDVAVGAGIGFLAGAAAGLALKSAAERFGWQDVATVGLFGAAIGAAPVGSAIGFLGGSAVGLVVWSVADSFDTPDLIGAAVAGLAIGGIAEWLISGIGAGSEDAPKFSVALPLTVGF
jgi:hypothetical protein